MGLHLEGLGKRLSKPFKRMGKKLGKVGKEAEKKVESGALGKVFRGLKKESKLAPVLHKEVLSALDRMQASDPSLGDVLEKAYGYVVFPRVGKASAVLGGAFGLGEVFEKGNVIGYGAIVQMTIGVQLGGQTYNELIVFQSREGLEEYKRNKVAFAANASAVIVTAGAGASAGKTGTRVFVQPEGGLGIEADIGGQKFIYKPAALGRIQGKLEPVTEHIHHPAQGSSHGAETPKR